MNQDVSPDTRATTVGNEYLPTGLLPTQIIITPGTIPSALNSQSLEGLHVSFSLSPRVHDGIVKVVATSGINQPCLRQHRTDEFLFQNNACSVIGAKAVQTFWPQYLYR